MIRYFAAHPTAANLLMAILVGIGLMSLGGLERETFPEIPVDEIEISVLYPGATPEDVESEICRRIEDAIDGVEDVLEVRSEALESMARVTVEIDRKASAQVVQDDLRTEVQTIDDFPERAEEPIIRQLARTQMVASIAVVGDMPPSDLKALCEELKEKLLRTDEIDVVELLGFSDHQIRIEMPATVLMQHGLDAGDIADAINRQSIDLPAGMVETRDQDVVVRFTDQRRTPQEFEDLVVIAGARGGELRLGDIARVTDVFEKEEEKLLFDGRRAGMLQVSKTRSQDSLDVVDAITRFIEEEEALLPASVDLVLTQDFTSIVRDRLEMLVKNGWQGLLLVFLTLWLFFSIRLSFWVVMGLPVSFLGAFFFMTWLDYSINMLTMVAMLLAVGLLMDDAIVIAENVATHLARGKRSLDAAVEGVREVLPGVLSSFATTVIVFGPISFLEGDIGVVLMVLPVVLILVMLVSLVEALLILPAHLSHALHHHDPNRKSRFRAGFEALLEGVRERVVGRAVDWMVRWRYLGLGLAGMLFLVAIGMPLSGRLPFRAFPDIDGDVVTARVLLPQGTPLSRTEEIVSRIVDAFSRVNDEFRPRQPAGKDLRRHISVQFNANADARESGPHVATVTVDLLDAETRDAAIDEVLRRWREEVGEIPDVISLVFAEPFFGPAGVAIELRLSAADLQQSKQASTDVIAWLNSFAGVFDVQDDLRPGKPEVRLRMRRGAASLGLSASMVAEQLRSAFLGKTVEEVQVGPESFEVELRFDRRNRDSLVDLEGFHVATPSGALVPLETAVMFESERGYARIARIDGRRTVTIKGDVDPQRGNVTELMETFISTEIPQLKERYPSLEIAIEGEYANGAETGKSLARGFLVGIIGIFLLLSFQFRSYAEPLVVMVAIPLCFVGVVLGHMIMGLPLTLPGMLGFVSLAGVVVNDSILLVEFIKIRLREGDSSELAARNASRLRFRAVLLTSVTTIAGMIPLLFETSLQAQILIPLATSVVFGLLASTVLILLVVPALFTIIADFSIESASKQPAESRS